MVFLKATAAIPGPYDPIVISRGSQKTGWEVELGVVIGRTARHVFEALYAAGYCAVNGVSERAFPARAGRPVGVG